MFAVEDDWIQYEAVPARRTAVRGGSACVQRVPVVREPVRLRPGDPRPPQRRAADRVGPSSAGRPQPRRRLRLTRRGRLVLVVLPGLLVTSGALLALSGTPSAEAASRPAPTETVVVDRGESLWAIAERERPGRDPRQVVADLERLNDLAGPVVAAGTALRLPARS